MRSPFERYYDGKAATAIFCPPLFTFSIPNKTTGYKTPTPLGNTTTFGFMGMPISKPMLADLVSFDPLDSPMFDPIDHMPEPEVSLESMRAGIYSRSEFFSQINDCCHTPGSILNWATKMYWGNTMLDCPPHLRLLQETEERGLLGSNYRSSHTRRGVKQLHNKVMSILSRVTRINFDPLLKELLSLPIKFATDNELQEVVKVFFEKSVEEPQFSELYAQLIAELCVVTDAERLLEKKKQMNLLSYRLKARLLYAYQEQFKRPLQLPDADKQHPNTGALLCDEEIEQKRQSLKNRVMGNIKFVGELYVFNLVSAQMITEIANLLVANYDPDKPLEKEDYLFEMFSILMKTVGIQYARDNPQELRQFLEKAGVIVETHLSSRVRFLLMNVQDLARKKWGIDVKTADPGICIANKTTTTASTIAVTELGGPTITTTVIPYAAVAVVGMQNESQTEVASAYPLMSRPPPLSPATPSKVSNVMEKAKGLDDDVSALDSGQNSDGLIAPSSFPSHQKPIPRHSPGNNLSAPLSHVHPLSSSLLGNVYNGENGSQFSFPPTITINANENGLKKNNTNEKSSHDYNYPDNYDNNNNKKLSTPGKHSSNGNGNGKSNTSLTLTPLARPINFYTNGSIMYSIPPSPLSPPGERMTRSITLLPTRVETEALAYRLISEFNDESKRRAVFDEMAKCPRIQLVPALSIWIFKVLTETRLQIQRHNLPLLFVGILEHCEDVYGMILSSSDLHCTLLEAVRLAIEGKEFEKRNRFFQNLAVVVSDCFKLCLTTIQEKGNLNINKNHNNSSCSGCYSDTVFSGVTEGSSATVLTGITDSHPVVRLLSLFNAGLFTLVIRDLVAGDHHWLVTAISDLMPESTKIVYIADDICRALQTSSPIPHITNNDKYNTDKNININSDNNNNDNTLFTSCNGSKGCTSFFSSSASLFKLDVHRTLMLASLCRFRRLPYVLRCDEDDEEMIKEVPSIASLIKNTSSERYNLFQQCFSNNGGNNNNNNNIIDGANNGDPRIDLELQLYRMIVSDKITVQQIPSFFIEQLDEGRHVTILVNVMQLTAVILTLCYPRKESQTLRISEKEASELIHTIINACPVTLNEVAQTAATMEMMCYFCCNSTSEKINKRTPGVRYADSSLPTTPMVSGVTPGCNSEEASRILNTVRSTFKKWCDTNVVDRDAVNNVLSVIAPSRMPSTPSTPQRFISSQNGSAENLPGKFLLPEPVSVLSRQNLSMTKVSATGGEVRSAEGNSGSQGNTNAKTPICCATYNKTVFKFEPSEMLVRNFDFFNSLKWNQVLSAMIKQR